MASALDSIALGRAALFEARWADARACFEAASALEPDSPDVLDGLSEARWWLGEWHESREIRERAFARHRANGARAEAARAAIWLANEYLIAAGNRAAWNGWLERAAGLLEGLEPCIEHGWLWFSRGRRLEDPTQMATTCGEALDLARRLGDVDLEIVALSQVGRALVAQGRATEGFARLDEAMAAVNAGEQRSHFTVAEACCNMLTTCEGAAEMERLAQWCRVTDDVSRRFNGLTMYSFCRLNHASVLLAQGRFVDAEQELLVGLEMTLRGYPAAAVALQAKLAELRLAQGRLDEAQEFLAGHEDKAVSVRPLAKLWLYRGEAEPARNLLLRRLSLVSSDSMQAAPLHALLVETKLALGDVSGAEESAKELVSLALATERAAWRAGGDYALGLVASAQQEPRAWVHFEAALERFVALEMPLEAARARLGMARALSQSDAHGAREMARRAWGDFERLGAARELDRAGELLRELGVAMGPGRRSEGLLSERESEVLDCLRFGASNAEIGKRLFISPKTVEHHVSKILGKLGLKTRAAAAAYASKQGRPESDAK
jgi:ATP/maltotriose-dependent transcriptional regulator MalT